MFRWFLIFCVLTLVVGIYWALMSGAWAHLNIQLQLNAALGEETIGDVMDRLDAVHAIINRQERDVKRLGFLAPHPNWTPLREARREADRVIRLANDLNLEGKIESQGSGAGSLREQVRLLESISVETFHPRQRLVWTILFWLCALPAAVFGLLPLVRASRS